VGVDTVSINIGATMFRTNDYWSFDFDTEMIHAEDYDFWVRTSSKNRMYNLQETLYFYRTHAEQVCTKYRKKQLETKAKVKLKVWSMFQYSKAEYSDGFLLKMINTNEPFTVKDYKKLKVFFRICKKDNLKRLKRYDPVLLNNVFKDLERDILQQFILKRRRGFNPQKLLKIFAFLPMYWKYIALKETIKYVLK